jgi:hypothetical protein
MFNGRRQPSRGGTSRMTRECQVRFCERLGVKFPGPTRQNPKLPHRNIPRRSDEQSGAIRCGAIRGGDNRRGGPTDPKIQFYAEIKTIERRLGDPNICLESFIVSNTPSHTMKMLWGMDKSAMIARHILFQEEDNDTYVKTMLESIAARKTALVL